MARSTSPGKWEATSVPGIYKRNGQYIVRVWNPWKGSKGGRDDYPARTFDEAKSIKRAKDAERQRRQQAGGERFTVRDWGGVPADKKQLPRDHPDRRPKWLQLMPRPKESTNQYNAERVAAFVEKYGARELPGVSPLEAQEWANEHPSTVNVIRAMLNDAKALRVIEDNPFDVIRVDRGRGRRDITTLKLDELGRLIEIAQEVHGPYGERLFGPLIGFFAWTGLRPGEMYALRPGDIDFTEREIHIERQWHSKLGRLEALKNGIARTVVLLDQADEYLQRVEMPAKGPIFTTVTGKQMTSRLQHSYWDEIRRRFTAELPADHWLPRRIREQGNKASLDIYELRHFFGTELAHAGCDSREIADQMGHLDGGKIANEFYIHLDEKRVRQSVRDKVRRAA